MLNLAEVLDIIPSWRFRTEVHLDAHKEWGDCSGGEHPSPLGIFTQKVGVLKGERGDKAQHDSKSRPHLPHHRQGTGINVSNVETERTSSFVIEGVFSGNREGHSSSVHLPSNCFWRAFRSVHWSGTRFGTCNCGLSAFWRDDCERSGSDAPTAKPNAKRAIKRLIQLDDQSVFNMNTPLIAAHTCWQRPSRKKKQMI